MYKLIGEEPIEGLEGWKWYNINNDVEKLNIHQDCVVLKDSDTTYWINSEEIPKIIQALTEAQQYFKDKENN